MSINQLKRWKVNNISQRPIIRTMETTKILAEKQPTTVAEKRKIIEEPQKEKKKVRSITEIIKEKPTSKLVREFFRERVRLINEQLENNYMI